MNKKFLSAILAADEQLQFEEHKERMIQEAKAKFLANFKVDRNNKVVRHRATDPASLQPTPDIPNVSNTNDLQSLRIVGMPFWFSAFAITYTPMPFR